MKDPKRAALELEQEEDKPMLKNNLCANGNILFDANESNDRFNMGKWNSIYELNKAGIKNKKYQEFYETIKTIDYTLLKNTKGTANI